MSVRFSPPAVAVITSESPCSAQQRYSPADTGNVPCLSNMGISFVMPAGTVDSESVTLSMSTLTSSASITVRSRCGFTVFLSGASISHRLRTSVHEPAPQPLERAEAIVMQPQGAQPALRGEHRRPQNQRLKGAEAPEVTKTVPVANRPEDDRLQDVIGEGR